MDSTELSAEDMKASLMKLCNPKTKIIQKENPKPVFTPTEKFRLNLKFESSNIRFNMMPIITPMQLAEGQGGGKSTNEIDSLVQQERSMIIDATVVRIMKTRKVLLHTDLV
jgi:aspartate-semialdehyde dehydrogenase